MPVLDLGTAYIINRLLSSIKNRATSGKIDWATKRIQAQSIEQSWKAAQREVFVCLFLCEGGKITLAAECA